MYHFEEEYDEVQPRAEAMIESLRAVGYTLPTAIADIIDNSITAGASDIILNFFWNGDDSYISVTDNGRGMTEEELKEAMRPGKNPSAMRSPSDLGRFGLGLKTASFSQSRCLTVASRAEGKEVNIRRWDLDYVSNVKRWYLLRSACPGSEGRLKAVENCSHGTVVLWERLDRVVGNVHVNDNAAHQRFLNLINSVEEYLSMIFHRYLEGHQPKLKIFINGTEDYQRIKPWDPFMEQHPSTIPYPNEIIPIETGVINVKGFVLPHKDKLGDELHKQLSGPAGWNAQQGFYVYRNERLLVPGSWLGLGSPRPWTKEEHYKLARIKIDIPNTVDMDWQIDVKKSTAKPPALIKIRLKELADTVRKQAREVFAHRGSYGQRQAKETITRAWKSSNSQGRISYKIDRTHPLIKQVLASVNEQKPLIDAMLRVIEETVPVQQIWLDTAEHSEVHSRPFEHTTPEEVKRLIEMTYRVLVNLRGIPPETARKRLASMDAFMDYTEIINEIA